MNQPMPIMLRPSGIRLPVMLPSTVRSSANPIIRSAARPPALAGVKLGQAWKEAGLLDFPIFAIARDGGATMLGLLVAMQHRGINTVMGVIGLVTGALGGIGLANDLWKVAFDKPLIGMESKDFGALFITAGVVGALGYLMFGNPGSTASRALKKVTA